MASQSAQTYAARPPDFLLYAMKNVVSVVVGGHVVEVVTVVHVMIGAQLDCAKYTRQREKGLFSNIKKKKSAGNFKKLEKTE